MGAIGLVLTVVVIVYAVAIGEWWYALFLAAFDLAMIGIRVRRAAVISSRS